MSEYLMEDIRFFDVVDILRPSYKACDGKDLFAEHSEKYFFIDNRWNSLDMPLTGLKDVFVQLSVLRYVIDIKIEFPESFEELWMSIFLSFPYLPGDESVPDCILFSCPLEQSILVRNLRFVRLFHTCNK